MIQFEEPIRDVKIIIEEYVRTWEKNVPRSYHGRVEFKTTAHLGSYLSGTYGVAQSLGYNFKGGKQRLNDRRVGRLQFEYRARHHGERFEFDNVHQFARFLEENPRFAELVEYNSSRLRMRLIQP